MRVWLQQKSIDILGNFLLDGRHDEKANFGVQIVNEGNKLYKSLSTYLDKVRHLAYGERLKNVEIRLTLSHTANFPFVRVGGNSLKTDGD
jgi:hypothetical protein